jgi:hypothetical protein
MGGHARLSRASRFFVRRRAKNVDGRNMSGHDVVKVTIRTGGIVGSGLLARLPPSTPPPSPYAGSAAEIRDHA